jgi:hypothetical protein
MRQRSAATVNRRVASSNLARGVNLLNQLVSCRNDAFGTAQLCATRSPITAAVSKNHSQPGHAASVGRSHSDYFECRFRPARQPGCVFIGTLVVAAETAALATAFPRDRVGSWGTAGTFTSERLSCSPVHAGFSPSPYRQNLSRVFSKSPEYSGAVRRRLIAKKTRRSNPRLPASCRMGSKTG